MAHLVVDSCALVHLKQAHHPATDALDLLVRLGDRGLHLVSTSRVHQENEQQTLRDWLGARATAGVYGIEVVSVVERRQVRNSLLKKMKEPGDNDKALIALAKRLEGPLLTHDGPAAALAERCRVVVIDAIDLAAFAVRQGIVMEDEAERMIGPLGRHAWSPPSWQGSVRATVDARPRWERLAERLDAWWSQ